MLLDMLRQKCGRQDCEAIEARGHPVPLTDVCHLAFILQDYHSFDSSCFSPFFLKMIPNILSCETHFESDSNTRSIQRMFQVSIPPSGFTLQAKRSPGRAQPRLGVESAARLLGFNSCREERFVGSLETLVSGSSRLRISTGPSVER